ncbi:hypothetical protein [uncultured Gammaproteobacteria bacterium]|jgi:hypothetical protein|nr:hypothetical protein [uncultured Gammaproteobacteria bacterium]CAC9557069.1 hypothetical protein [uncultured Gammaproteobacteria bacterium]CAC9560721.1 hypothetical protein [uncultured Gammaproteobacteria bacterium]CAC9965264.1 hypothetical protein [uncultured Gammaproteobacteria bacterium]CAC9965714.1 hypothetical protein [uncultured Gammaproteobacteria bacterium]
MNEEEYLNDRLNDQINWYSKKSQTNQKWFKGLRLLEIIAATIIPFLAGIGSIIPYYLIIIGVLGVIIAVSAGLSALYKYHENWIEYRTTSETLKHEKYLFQAKCSPYDGDEAFCKLVQRVEGLISKENTQWSRYVEKTKNT